MNKLIVHIKSVSFEFELLFRGFLGHTRLTLHLTTKLCIVKLVAQLLKKYHLY